MSFTTYGENLLLNWALTAGVATRPTAWFAALHTDDPTETGSVNEVLLANDAAYTAIAGRKSVTFTTATTGISSNVAGIAHTPDATASAYTVKHISIWDSQSGGNCLMYGQLQVAKTIDNANPLALNIGDIIAALD